MITAEFSKFASILSAALSQHHLLGFEIAQQIDGETVETVVDFILGGSQITTDSDYNHERKIYLSLKESYDQPRQHIKKQRWYFANKSPSNEHPGLISFRIYWLDRLGVQGTLKHLLQHHSSKASILLC